jgi:hypothetical protein
VSAAGIGLDQAVAVGVEVVPRVACVSPQGGGEGVDECAVDPGRVQQLKLAEQAAGLQVLVAFVGGLDPRLDEPARQRQFVQGKSDRVDIRRARGTGSSLWR